MPFEFQDQTILIIDDEPNNLQVTAQFLERQGLEVMLAKSGEKGIELAQKGQPDLIILDVRMPVMDGYATCHALKQLPETRDIPVLFYSALGEVDDKLKGFALGGLDYLTKPVDESELLARVAVHLQNQAMKQELSERNQRLQGAIDTGNVVNVAIGVVMERHRLGREAAFNALRDQARAQRRKVRDLAAELLAAMDVVNTIGRP
ncbi:MAG: response regulator [Magnetococcus sp. WYHC-3]